MLKRAVGFVALLLTLVLSQGAAAAESTYVGQTPPAVGPTAGQAAPTVAAIPQAAPAPKVASSGIALTGGDVLGMIVIAGLLLLVGVTLVRAARRPGRLPATT
jgi:hypothetical protein